MFHTIALGTLTLLTRLRFVLTMLALAGILGATLWPFNFNQTNGASLSVEGLTFSRNGTAFLKSQPPLPEKPGSFTIVALFQPASLQGTETALVFGYARNFLRQNMILAQVGSTVGFKFALGNGGAHHIWANCLTSLEPARISLTHDGSRSRLYYNGVLKNEQFIGKNDSIEWDHSLPFAFGSDGSGDMTWLGTVISLTIEPGVAQLDQNGDFVSPQSPWLSFDFPESSSRRASGLYVPEKFRPASKITVFDTLMYWQDNRYYVVDMILNVILFVPLGVGLGLILRNPNRGRKNPVLLAGLLGLGLTVLIEILQFYLPTRFPSLSDILTNSVGTLVGTMFISWIGSMVSQSPPKTGQTFRRPSLAGPFTRGALALDAAMEVEAIAGRIRSIVSSDFRKRGAVIAVSGGIDSAVCAALCVHALGPDRVFALLLPERASSPESTQLGRELTDKLGVRTETHDISGILEAAGCYRSQDDAIRTIVPEYGAGWKHKVVLPSLLDNDRLNVTRLVVESPEGSQSTHRLSASAYLQLIAATNFKQRTRKMLEYFHADRLNYAVCGTPNRLEYDQGFFVKLGDGSADFKPIAHLYKTQVYAVGSHLGVPVGILKRPPTTDTFTIPQSQEEFYYSLPFEMMDLCLFAFNHSVSAADTASALGLSAGQVERAFEDFQRKRTTTRPLHLPPQLIKGVPEIEESVHGPEQPGMKS